MIEPEFGATCIEGRLASCFSGKHKYNRWRNPKNGEDACCDSQCAGNMDLSRWNKTTTSRNLKEKILKPLRAKIKNPKDNSGEEAGGIIKDNTEARIRMDHDTMSIILSPPFL